MVGSIAALWCVTLFRSCREVLSYLHNGAAHNWRGYQEVGLLRFAELSVLSIWLEYYGRLQSLLNCFYHMHCVCVISFVN